jgi:hypothetical protein
MIDAYLDESGIHDGAAVCVISGYFGGRGQWEKFEQLWRKTLADFKVPLDNFHAKEFVKRRDFFSGWDDRLYKDFTDATTDAIIKYKIHPVTVGIVVEDFNSFSHVQKRFFTGARLRDDAKGNWKLVTSGAPSKPYFCPFQECMAKVAEAAPVGGKAHFFFGLDRPFAEYARAFMKEIVDDPYAPFHERIGRNPAFPLAKETPQLQAADLLAYRSYLDMTDRVQKNTWHEFPPMSLRRLMERRRSMEDFVYYNKETLKITLDNTYKFSGNWDGHTSP